MANYNAQVLLNQTFTNLATFGGPAFFAYGYVYSGTSNDDTIYGSSYTTQNRLDGSFIVTDLVYGDDNLNGGDGHDLIHGGAGHDTLAGGSGNDTVRGMDDNDKLQGNGGNDIVEGGAGNDTVQGGLDNDSVSGGDGNDYISGDASNLGYNTLNGGAGADIFHTAGNGHDIVNDFSYAGGDRVMVDGTTYTLSQVGTTTLITMATGFEMQVLNFNYGSAAPDWIYIV
jgi:serralysin